MRLTHMARLRALYCMIAMLAEFMVWIGSYLVLTPDAPVLLYGIPAAITTALMTWALVDTDELPWPTFIPDSAAVHVTPDYRSYVEAYAGCLLSAASFASLLLYGASVATWNAPAILPLVGMAACGCGAVLWARTKWIHRWRYLVAP